jgi:Putative transposase/Transposase zinc-binding domain
MDLAAVLKEHWAGFARRFSFMLTALHHRAAQAVMWCRTPELGGEYYKCDPCAEGRFVYHSCNHRACPKCGGLAQKEWAQAQEVKLLPVAYFMLTFTLPSELREFIYRNQAWFYDLMFKAAADVLNHFARDPKHLGGTPGYTAVLHTWTRQMIYHPHLHIIMPGVALSEDGLRLMRAKGDKFLFPVKALGAAWRNRLHTLISAHDAEGARQQAEGNRQEAEGKDSAAEKETEPKLTAMSQIPASVWQKPWIVHSQSAGNGTNAVRYLARYVTKSAVSNQRLQGYDESGKLKLNCQDSDSGEWSTVRLTPDEFLRRWCQHILPNGLMRVRHYGWLSAAAKARLERVRFILQVAAPVKPAPIEPPKPKCPCCGQDMERKGRLNRVELMVAMEQAARAPPRQMQLRLVPLPASLSMPGGSSSAA